MKLPTKKEQCDALFERNVICVGHIDKRSAEQIVDQLHALALKGEKRIRLRITSTGGKVFQGLHVYDTILCLRKSGVEVDGYVVGECSSMALVILQACSRRISTRFSRFLAHYTSLERLTRGGKHLDAKIDRYKRTIAQSSEQVVTILKARFTGGEGELESLLERGNNDEYLYAPEAHKLGFLDEVVDAFDLLNPH